MKLTSRSDLVKPDRTVVAVAALTAVVTVAVVQLILVVTNRERVHMDRFGDTTAGALAELVADPLMREDRMHLGVIGNRLAELPEVRGVASYSPDNQLLASAGAMDGPQYSASVTLDGRIVGYVRVAVFPPAFEQSHTARTLSLLAVMVLIPLLVAAGWAVAAAARRGELAGALPARPRWLPPPRTARVEPEPEADPIEPEPESQPEIRHYLLAINLYNQLTLPRTEREFELSLCLELAGAVAEVYQGQVVALPGVGGLVDFDHTEEDDRAFEVLCAALVLIRLLRDEAPFGHYRLGLNLTGRPADEVLPLDDDAIADASLLSALGKDDALAISAPFGQALGNETRVRLKPLVNPLLDELVTSGPGCHLVTDLEAPFAALVVQQAAELRSQRDEISSPSTF